MKSSFIDEFGPFRSIFWPIHPHELRRFIPALFIIFFICFNYSILRSMKDSVVVTAMGAEAIFIIKVWALLPTAVLFAFIYTRLSRKYSQEKITYIFIFFFLLFFALFAFVLYPLREQLHPHLDVIKNWLPCRCAAFIRMIEYWMFTAFYVMAELWGTFILTVLFWGFANETTSSEEAPRFYAVYVVGSNLSAIIAGQFANLVSRFNQTLSSVGGSWEQTQRVLIFSVIMAGIAGVILFKWLHLNGLGVAAKQQNKSDVNLKKKPKFSLRESFAYLSGSKYLICIAILVVSYNLVINLGEIIWKDQLKILYPSVSGFNRYMNNLTTAVGIFSTVGAFFIARLVNRLGWTGTALITPGILLFTSGGFFLSLFFQKSLGGFFLTMAGINPLAMLIFFGGAQNCLSKSAKYSVFDATKEIAFIPLESEVRLKGKAAIDGVGSRIGKSGGSLIHQGLFLVCGSIAASTPFIATIIMVAIAIWIIATVILGREFYALTGISSEINPPLSETLFSREKPEALPASGNA